MIRCNYSDNLVKVAEQKLPVGNIYKMVRTHNENEFVMGCGEGLFFMNYRDLNFELSEEKVFHGKYVT